MQAIEGTPDGATHLSAVASTYCPSLKQASSSVSLHLEVINARSVVNKALEISDHILENKIDILALTETWLSANDPVPPTELTPPGYSIVSSPRPHGRGGGVAVLHKNSLKVAKREETNTVYELLLCTFKPINNVTLTLAVLYRPPTSCITAFMDEFSSWLEVHAAASGQLIIVGDFNIHVDDVDNIHAKRLKSLLDNFNLHQHVVGPTHVGGHTLDLVITPQDSQAVSETRVKDFMISDHYNVVSKVNIVRPKTEKTYITYRKVRNIKTEEFARDVADINVTGIDDPSFAVDVYESNLSRIFNHHAPEKTRLVTVRTNAPWFTDELQVAKHERRRHEKSWRKSGLLADKELYREQRNNFNRLLKEAKAQYYSKLISEERKNPKKLFQVIDVLINGRKAEKTLPDHPSGNELASVFDDFFEDKIEIIRAELENKQRNLPHLPVIEITSDTRLSEFAEVSEESVTSIIKNSPAKQCDLDQIPTWLLKSCLPSVVKSITHIINLSMQQSTVPTQFKTAVISPILKKTGLNPNELKNYRPISNLSFLSKTLERVVAEQLQNYLCSNHLHEKFQSAYKSRHSVETALLRVQNDILRSLDDGNAVVLLLLDLSAAFDTIDHSVLLKRLHELGIRDSALTWFKSYLSDRLQIVRTDSASSNPAPLQHGVPQGSVLGPLLFSVFVLPLAKIIEQYGLSGHYYADDTQVYLSFRPSSQATAMGAIGSCCNAIKDWMTANMLKLNEGKTEMVVFRSRYTTPLNKQALSMKIGESSIIPASTARNLGCIMDETLTMETHIALTCRNAFYHLRNLKRIRRYLTREATEQLVHAFVTSRLDFCNSLLFGIQKQHLQKLQRVQNAAARVICEIPTRDSVRGTLKELHWLPIKERVDFKILTLTYQAIDGSAPPYLTELLTPYMPRRSCRSENQRFLVTPSTHYKRVGDRAFSNSAPSLWNQLPLLIKNASSVDTFKKLLKTHLFKQASLNVQ